MKKQIKWSINRAGEFNIKPVLVPHKDSVGIFSYNSEIKGYDVKHVLCVSKIQLFFLWWYLWVYLPIEHCSQAQYKVYERKECNKKSVAYNP
jgi:hypothetical protein